MYRTVRVEKSADPDRDFKAPSRVLSRNRRLAAAIILAFAFVSSLLVSNPARAECGGDVDCIAVSIDPAVEPTHGSPLVSATLAFGSQLPGTTSASRAILVRHVGGRDGLATIQSITLGGADASEFNLAGGDCAIGVPSLPRDGPSCQVQVTFGPGSTGLKNASVVVASPSISRTIPLSGFGDDGSLPDPGEDTILPGQSRDQADTARRFSAMQIANIQQRMERLGRDNRNLPGQATAGSRDSESPIALALMQFAANGSISLAALDNASDPGPRASGDRWWIAGDLLYGSRDDTESDADRTFSSDGITIGYDRHLDAALALGFSVGFARSDSEVSDNPSNASADAASVAGYLSFRPAPGIFVNGLLGFGEISYDTERFDVLANGLARSSRDGDQVFASVAAGYDLGNRAWRLQPYARIDLSRASLGSATESGVGALNLAYDSEDFETIRLALGMVVEAPHETSYGAISPRLRVELQHDEEDNGDSSVSYASQPGAGNFTIVPSDHDEQSLLLGLGGTLYFRNGLQFDIEYSGRHGSDSEGSQNIFLNLSGSLDDVVPALPTVPIADASPVNAEFGYSSVSNINRASERDDELDDHLVDFALRREAIFGVSRLSRVSILGSLAMVDHRRHQGLDNLSGSLRVDYRFRTSNQFTASTYGIYGQAAVDAYESSLRSGNRTALGLSLQKRLTDRVELLGSVENSSRNADSVVFDTDDNRARLFVDYGLSRASFVSLGFEIREGDSVTSASGSNALSAIADEIDTDDAYLGKDFFAYRIETDTEIVTLAYNRRLGQQDSLDIALQFISAEPGDAPPGVELDYESQRLAIFYLMRF